FTGVLPRNLELFPSSAGWQGECLRPIGLVGESKPTVRIGQCNGDWVRLLAGQPDTARHLHPPLGMLTRQKNKIVVRPGGVLYLYFDSGRRCWVRARPERPA